MSSTTPQYGSLTVVKAGVAELDMLAAVSVSAAIASRVALLPLNSCLPVSFEDLSFAYATEAHIKDIVRKSY